MRSCRWCGPAGRAAPPTSAGLLHLTFAGAAVAAAVFAPGRRGAVPRRADRDHRRVGVARPAGRPRLRGIVSGVDPCSPRWPWPRAALTPRSCVDQLALQNAARVSTRRTRTTRTWPGERRPGAGSAVSRRSSRGSQAALWTTSARSSSASPASPYRRHVVWSAWPRRWANGYRWVIARLRAAQTPNLHRMTSTAARPGRGTTPGSRRPRPPATARSGWRPGSPR